MKLKEFDFSLDIKKHKRIEDIILVENDRQTARFNINLMDGNQAFLIGENADVSIAFQKSDDTYVEQECTLTGNKVSIVLSDQILAKSGKVIAEIIIRSDNQVLTTTSFDFHVRKNILNNKAIESTNEIGVLNKLIDTVKELIQKVINSTPKIGDNGNWFIGDKDTGKPSRGPKGDKGDKGEQGLKGEKGDKGDKGIDGIGAVHSVNDQVGDVYLTGEDIRVNQNQQWSVSYAVNSLDESKLNLSGGTMTGDIDMDYNKISKGVLGAPYKSVAASTLTSSTWNLTLNVPCRAVKLTGDINVVLRGDPGGTNSMSEVIVLIEQPDTAHNVTFTTGIWRDGDSEDLLKVANRIHQVRILKIKAHPFNLSLLEYVGSYPV